MKLRKSTTRFAYTSEGSPPAEEPKVNFFRLLYFGILTVIVVYLVQYFLYQQFVTRGQGTVVTQSKDYHSPVYGKVTGLYVQKHGRVDQNASLFSVLDYNTLHNTSSNEAKLLSLKQDLAQYRIERQSLQIQLNEVEKEIKEKELYNAMELYIDKRRSDTLNNRAQELRAQVKVVDAMLGETQKLYDEVAKMSVRKQQPVVLTTSAVDDAEVLEVYKKQDEFVKRGEKIVTLHDPESIMVIGYFYMSRFEDIHTNQLVSVVFPNETDSYGVISEVDFVAMQSDMPISDMMIKVTVVPQSDTSKALWKKFKGTQVKLRIYPWY